MRQVLQVPTTVFEAMRRRLGWSQRYVAARLATGQHVISRVERGVLKPDAGFRRDASELFMVPDVLFQDFPVVAGSPHRYPTMALAPPGATGNLHPRRCKEVTQPICIYCQGALAPDEVFALVRYDLDDVNIDGAHGLCIRCAAGGAETGTLVTFAQTHTAVMRRRRIEAKTKRTVKSK